LHPATADVGSQQISVIDTPGLYDDELGKQGNCEILIVIKVGRFTEEGKNTIKELKEVFGEQIEKYTMILFTHKDGDPDLKKLVESCGNRFFCLDNESASFPQFKDLLSKIKKMVEENRGTHFTNDMFKGTEKHIQEIQKKKLDEKVKQHKKVTQSEWQKTYRGVTTRNERVMNETKFDFVVAEYLEMDVVDTDMDEVEGAIKKAKSKGFSSMEATEFAVRAIGKLAKK
ncbi:hypothetical protein PO909_000736, partial [Leuciscus waleckii]